MPKRKVYNNFFNKEIYDKVNQENKDIMDDFLLELKQIKKSAGTISQYHNDLRIAFIYIYKKLDNKSILELNKRDFRGYSLYLTSECGVSAARHNRMLCSIRSLLTFVENEDMYEYDTNIAKKVKGLSKEPVRDIFFLTNEQIMKLKDELIKREKYQFAALLALAYDSAGRRSEIAQVNKMSFYDASLNNTNKVIGKRRKVFSLIYFRLTKECVKLWLDHRGEDDIESLWILQSGKNKKEADSELLYDWFMYMRDLLEEIEGKDFDFNPHSIRHSALQNMSDGTHYICKDLGMEAGFPVEKLRLIANHSDVSTTQGYLKDTSIDELANMFNISITE
jgi:integrase